MRNTMITFWRRPADILPEKANYMVYQHEICPETNKDHWQGYVEWKDKMFVKGIKEIFNDQTLHIESRKGSQEQAIKYCTKTESRKDGTAPVHLGKPKMQGSRSDLDAILEDIEGGMTCKEILIKYQGNALRHISHIQKALKVYHKMDEMDRYIVWSRKNANEPEKLILTELNDDSLCIKDKIENKKEKSILDVNLLNLKTARSRNTKNIPEVDGNTSGRPLTTLKDLYDIFDGQ